MLDLTALQKKPAAAGIRDTDAANFERDVLAVSMHTPVIVDFWAPWCGPCKQMMPALEKVITEQAGAVQMVKVDIDKSPQLAQVFRVQSVPMVYAFYQGQPVDGFMGAKPESELRAFVEKIKNLAGANANAAPAADVTAIMAEADKYFQAADYTNAMAQYSTALDAAPENMDAMAGIGWCFAEQKEFDAVREILSTLTAEQLQHPRLQALQGLLSWSEGAGDIAALTAQLEKNPKDHDARFDLARAHLATGETEQAIEDLVEITRQNREWQQQKARNFLIGIFDVLGPAHPLTALGRRRLSAVLFS